MAKRGFASMDDKKHEEASRKGGENSHRDLSSSQASKMGKMGAKAQPTEAKRKGGESSRRSS